MPMPRNLSDASIARLNRLGYPCKPRDTVPDELWIAAMLMIELDHIMTGYVNRQDRDGPDTKEEAEEYMEGIRDRLKDALDEVEAGFPTLRKGTAYHSKVTGVRRWLRGVVNANRPIAPLTVMGHAEALNTGLTWGEYDEYRRRGQKAAA